MRIEGAPISLKEAEEAGNDLGQRLEAEGADGETIESVCFAFGQRISAMIAAEVPCDTEEEADEIVRRFRLGERDIPGPDLARRLCEQYPPRLGTVLAQLRAIRGNQGNNP